MDLSNSASAQGRETLEEARRPRTRAPAPEKRPAVGTRARSPAPASSASVGSRAARCLCIGVSRSADFTTRSGRYTRSSTSTRSPSGSNAGVEITPELLREHGLVSRRSPIKVLARGDIAKALTVRAHKFSVKAAEKIASAGGNAEVLAQ